MSIHITNFSYNYRCVQFIKNKKWFLKNVKDRSYLAEISSLYYNLKIQKLVAFLLRKKSLKTYFCKKKVGYLELSDKYLLTL